MTPLVIAAEPSVGVVILSRNGVDHTLECLASLRQSRYRNHFVAVVDNGSTDSVVRNVRQQFPEAHVIETVDNLGFTGGNNVGMGYALGRGADYLWLLNNDTAAPPDTLAQLVALAERHPRIGMAYPLVTSYFDHTKSYVTAMDWERGRGGELLASPTEAEYSEADYAAGCALFVRSAVARQIGLLDPAFFIYYEDVDWSLRCKKAGYQVVVAWQAHIYHKGTPDQTRQKAPIHWYYYLRNQRRFIGRYIAWRCRGPLIERYNRECLLQFQQASEAGQVAEASAVIDGWWAGVTGRYGPQRVTTPGWLQRLILRHLAFFLKATTPIASLRQRFPVRSTARRLWRSLGGARL
jgi:GT2 family glycosyltransferase